MPIIGPSVSHDTLEGEPMEKEKTWEQRAFEALQNRQFTGEVVLTSRTMGDAIRKAEEQRGRK